MGLPQQNGLIYMKIIDLDHARAHMKCVRLIVAENFNDFERIEMEALSRSFARIDGILEANAQGRPDDLLEAKRA